MLAVIFFALGYMSYGAIFAAVGALAPGAREAQQYAGFFGFIAVIPIVLLPVFLTDPSAPIVLAAVRSSRSPRRRRCSRSWPRHRPSRGPGRRLADGADRVRGRGHGRHRPDLPRDPAALRRAAEPARIVGAMFAALLTG